MYYDIHCHLTDDKFKADRDDVIKRALNAGVTMITIGTNETTSNQAILLAEKYDNIFATVGLHPNEISDDNISRATLSNMIAHPKVVGVGECGFDYYNIEKTPEIISTQEKAFRVQIECALENNKPLMLHNRSTKGTYDAYEDSLRVLSEYYPHQEGLGRVPRGNVHFFAGNIDIIKRFLDIGFYISFTGVITFATEYEELIRAVPIDRLLLETDAPYVAPVPYRGKRCEPVYVIEVYKKVVDVLNLTDEELQKQMQDNVKRLFL